MAKTAYINVRVEKKLKTDAEKVLRDVGVGPSDVVTMLYKQLVLHQGIPFEVRIPNKESRKALAEARNPAKRAKLKRYKTTEEMFADILSTK